MHPRHKQVVPFPPVFQRDIVQWAQPAYKPCKVDKRTERQYSNRKPVERRDTLSGCHCKRRSQICSTVSFQRCTVLYALYLPIQVYMIVSFITMISITQRRIYNSMVYYVTYKDVGRGNSLGPQCRYERIG